MRSTTIDYVFTGVCLFKIGGGGGGVTPSPFRSTSTGLMSFLGGGTPVTCPRSLPGGTPVTGPRPLLDGGGYLSPGRGVPQSQARYPRTGYPQPGHDWYTPPQAMTGYTPQGQVMLGQVMPRAVCLLRFPGEGLSSFPSYDIMCLHCVALNIDRNWHGAGDGIGSCKQTFTANATSFSRSPFPKWAGNLFAIPTTFACASVKLSMAVSVNGSKNGIRFATYVDRQLLVVSV